MFLGSAWPDNPKTFHSHTVHIIRQGGRLTLKIAAVVFLLLAVMALEAAGALGTSDQPMREVDAGEILAKVEAGQPVEYDHVVVRGDLDLSWDRLQKNITSPIRINDSIFNGIVSFNSSILEMSVNLSGSNFTRDVFFRRANFSYYALFWDAAFNDYADFNGGTFRGDTIFDGAAFNGEADFDGAAFKSDTAFEKAIFSGRTAFEEAAFGGIADFDGAAFNSDADFEKAVFSGTTEFSKATFNGLASFMWVTFGGDAYFGEATFKGSAHFRRVTFSGNAYFWNAFFGERADFWDATFGGEFAFFNGVTFSGYAEFPETTFNGIANFVGGTFRGNAVFQDATFSEDAYFVAAAFICDSNFIYTEFNGNIEFSDARFENETSFYRILFKRPAYFENCSIESLNLTKAEYSRLHLHWGDIKRLHFDEAAYLALIKNYYNLGWYGDANDCYFNYRNAVRENWQSASSLGFAVRLSSLLDRVIDFGEWLLYGYGVRPSFPIAWSAAIILAFGLFFRQKRCLRKIITEERIEDAGDGSDEVLVESKARKAPINSLDPFLFSLFTFTSGFTAFLHPAVEYKLERCLRWAIAERLLGPFFLALVITTISKTYLIR